jgi:hypothetical protein
MLPSSPWRPSWYGCDECPHDLALQLRFPFEMGAPRFSLVSASPDRPRDDMGGLDAPLRQLDRDTTDFLDRPADQKRRLF